MPRLDIWLTEKGQFRSRQSAKRAIKSGFILVNGRQGKPSTNVSEEDEIIISEQARDVPLGFEKLKTLVSTIESLSIRSGMRILDIGSSAGGFLLYLLEQGASVIGIEVSNEFLVELETLVERYDNLSILIDDAFSQHATKIFHPKEFDILLIDVTTDPDGTFTLTERYTNFLKDSSTVILAVKSNKDDFRIAPISELLEERGFSEIHVIQLEPSRTETHVVAIRH